MLLDAERYFSTKMEKSCSGMRLPLSVLVLELYVQIEDSE